MEVEVEMGMLVDTCWHACTGRTGVSDVAVRSAGGDEAGEGCGTGRCVREEGG